MAVLLNPIDPDFLADPYPTYARLRDEAPIYRHPGGFVAVSRYADVQTALHNPEVFPSRAADRYGCAIPSRRRSGAQH